MNARDLMENTIAQKNLHSEAVHSKNLQRTNLIEKN